MLSNYPDGLSDSTVGAPWNEESIPEKEFEVTCSQSLSKTVTVWTDNYIPGASGVDYERDDEGGIYVINTRNNMIRNLLNIDKPKEEVKDAE